LGAVRQLECFLGCTSFSLVLLILKIKKIRIINKPNPNQIQNKNYVHIIIFIDSGIKKKKKKRRREEKENYYYKIARKKQQQNKIIRYYSKEYKKKFYFNYIAILSLIQLFN